jgi:hypothetical protein
MHYILSYDVVDDYVERRARFREAHLKLAREAHERGEKMTVIGDDSSPLQ